MTDSKVQIRKNFKVVGLRLCYQRIIWLQQRIRVWEEVKKEDRENFRLQNRQHLSFLKYRLQEEIRYKTKLSQHITTTTC